MRITVRKTTNYQVVTDLNRQVFGEGMDLPFANHECWLAYDRGTPIAYASYQRVEGNAVFLSRVGVLSDYRGQGLQKRLIKARCRDAKSKGVRWAITYTSLVNAASFGSLQSCGFKMYLPEFRWAGTEFIYWRKQLNG